MKFRYVVAASCTLSIFGAAPLLAESTKVEERTLPSSAADAEVAFDGAALADAEELSDRELDAVNGAGLIDVILGSVVDDFTIALGVDGEEFNLSGDTPQSIEVDRPGTYVKIDQSVSSGDIVDLSFSKGVTRTETRTGLRSSSSYRELGIGGP